MGMRLHPLSNLFLNQQNILDKVKNKEWVLRECLTRVPGTLEQTQQLLEYGKKMSNIEDLVRVNLHYHISYSYRIKLTYQH